MDEALPKHWQWEDGVAYRYDLPLLMTVIYSTGYEKWYTRLGSATYGHMLFSTVGDAITFIEEKYRRRLEEWLDVLNASKTSKEMEKLNASTKPA